MANFKTHISTSTVLGIGYGLAAWQFWDMSPQHCIVAGGLCSVAGMLPDLDSDSGVPVRETLSFVSVLVPMLMLSRFQALGMDAEQIVFASALVYVGIRFGIGTIFRRYTKHRGMWHSLPAAAIAGLATYLICLSPELHVRLLKSCAVVIGFLSHLILDEIYAVDLYGRKVRLKKSFGTALKLFGNSTWGNFTTYAKLIVLVLIVMGDESLMRFLGAEPIDIRARATAAGEATREWVGELVPVTTDNRSMPDSSMFR